MEPIMHGRAHGGSRRDGEMARASCLASCSVGLPKMKGCAYVPFHLYVAHLWRLEELGRIGGRDREAPCKVGTAQPSTAAGRGSCGTHRHARPPPGPE
eukprot:scaffold11030_cov121-Isochrysis_galbana.AAC.2